MEISYGEKSEQCDGNNCFNTFDHGRFTNSCYVSAYTKNETTITPFENLKSAVKEEAFLWNYISCDLRNQRMSNLVCCLLGFMNMKYGRSYFGCFALVKNSSTRGTETFIYFWNTMCRASLYKTNVSFKNKKI